MWWHCYLRPAWILPCRVVRPGDYAIGCSSALQQHVENIYYAQVSGYLYIISRATDVQLPSEREQEIIHTIQQQYIEIIISKDAEWGVPVKTEVNIWTGRPWSGCEGDEFLGHTHMLGYWCITQKTVLSLAVLKLSEWHGGSCRIISEA